MKGLGDTFWTSLLMTLMVGMIVALTFANDGIPFLVFSFLGVIMAVGVAATFHIWWSNKTQKMQDIKVTIHISVPSDWTIGQIHDVVKNTMSNGMFACGDVASGVMIGRSTSGFKMRGVGTIEADNGKKED